jgi:L-rhamnose-H+ transport protein
LWGVVLHEWRGTGGRTKALGTLGFSLLVLSTIVVGYGNYLKAR